MGALKEGFGWSDAQLYEQVQYNLLVMKALGFENLSDKTPVPSTYYLFKQALYHYQVEHGRDLIQEAFKSLTKTQAEIFDVNGDRDRMGSRLIGSNLVCCSRLQLILSCLQAFWKSLSQAAQNRLDEGSRQQLDDLCQKQPHHIVYSLSEAEKTQKLVTLGNLLLYLHRFYDDSDSGHYSLLERLLNEQYRIEGDQTALIPRYEIPADSIQSPHDPDAVYRKKGTQTVVGNSVNVTETCNDKGLNLIIKVQVEKATQADVDFVQPALDNAMEVIGPIGKAHLDGAYQFPENAEYSETHFIQMIFTGIQGAKGRFEFTPIDQGLFVFDTQSDQKIKVTEYKADHYKIKVPSGGGRYFKPKEIDCFNWRQTIEYFLLRMETVATMWNPVFFN
jgi:hypothetical protein